MSSSPAALLLLRGVSLLPSLRLRCSTTSSSSSALLYLPSLARASYLCTAAEPNQPSDNTSFAVPPPEIPGQDPAQRSRVDPPDFRRWKDKEAEILQDIEPITSLVKDILHSSRYKNGEILTVEDEKAVVKLLAYHPHSEDKIGCGLAGIMVDRHPQFNHSRCLFVIRTDGVWIDFSYQKCLRAYIQKKYPSHAERFIRQHFKRGSS